MGVDFYSCSICGEIYDDCGHLYNWCEECGTMICFSCQVELSMRDMDVYISDGAKTLGDYWDGSTLIRCPKCKNEIIDDDRVLSYLLQKYKLNKEDIIAEIKKEN